MDLSSFVKIFPWKVPRTPGCLAHAGHWALFAQARADGGARGAGGTRPPGRGIAGGAWPRLCGAGRRANADAGSWWEGLVALLHSGCSKADKKTSYKQ